MNYMAMFDEIKNNKIGSLYLFYGAEEFVKSEALAQMADRLVSKDFAGLNYQIIDGTEVSGGSIIDACETLPFMSDRRLVVVKDHPGLTGKRAGEGSSDEEALKDYLERLPDSTCLLFYCHGDVNKTRALYKALTKIGKVVEFPLLERKELMKWTSRAFRKSGREISPADLELFLDRAGNSLERISKEVEKLVSYTKQDPVITGEIIQKMVKPLPEHTVFQLIDSIAARKKSDALKLLDVLMENGEPVMLILTLLARQIKIILLCKEYQDMKLSYGMAVDRLTAIEGIKVHPYTAKKCMAQARNFTSDQLKSALKDCADLDFNIKSGRIEDRIGMELLIVKMCN
ncbi:MAG TPA: DNA polymerase III subunit delta [Candidatus Atribacteria bacterium]|nr:DNA polymerase III subunit delta [Candidatus Atribacteria bacterium]HPT78878.1 DNA polymerase III subunit delta [Candidatus Atribacteria bacterium]